MKRILSIFLIVCAYTTVSAQSTNTLPISGLEQHDFFDPTKKQEKAPYVFGIDYRIEVGYVQNNQRTTNLSYPNLYLHGARLGATFDFRLPLHFSIQTGLLYTITYGVTDQRWPWTDKSAMQAEKIRHGILEHDLTIPVRAFYAIPLWKKLSMFFYVGPQLQIGLAEKDYIKTELTDATRAWLEANGRSTSSYDRLAAGELYRTNIQLGVGGGFEWDRYRIQAGYDFGLNNRVKNKINNDNQMWEWQWNVSFQYRF